jgi:hypothetical protein
MVAADSLTEQSPPLTPPLGIGRGQRRALCLGLSALLVVPVVIAIFRVVGRHYVPIGDEASMLFRTQQVGTRSTPLVGVYSTRGWAHPGPILYYLLAVPYRLSGGSPVSLFVAAALIVLASMLGILALAYRRRGLPGLLVFAVLTATLLYGLRPDTFIQIWNPYVSLFPYLAFLIMLWGLAEGDRGLLPVAVAVGSACIQMHVAYLPLVGSAAIATAVWAVIRYGLPSLRDLRRPLVLVSAGIFVVLWLPPVIDLLWGDHNLLHVFRYFRHRGMTSTAGLSDGLGLLSGHLSWHGPWAGGHERVFFYNVQPETLAYLVVLVLALVVAAGLCRAAIGSLPFLPYLALVQILVGAVAAARVETPVLSYLIVWMLPLAAFCWGAVLVPLVDAAQARTWKPPYARPALAGVAVCLALVVTGRTAASAVHTPLPRQSQAQAVEAVVGQLRTSIQPGDRVRIEGVGEELYEGWVGVLYGLSQQVHAFYTSDGAAGQKWGTDHRWNGQRVDYTLTLAVSEPSHYQDPVAECLRQPGERLIASWDQMSDAERAEYLKLVLLNAEDKGKLPPGLKARYDELGARAYRLAVFRGNDVCGF